MFLDGDIGERPADAFQTRRPVLAGGRTVFEWTERIWGTFKEGDTRRLEIRLRRLRKNLSVDWK